MLQLDVGNFCHRVETTWTENRMPIFQLQPWQDLLLMQSRKQHGSLGKHYQIIHRSNGPLSLWLISLRALGQQTVETNTFQDRCQPLISILKLQQSSIYLLRHIFSACGHYCLEVLELNWSMLTISVFSRWSDNTQVPLGIVTLLLHVWKAMVY